MAKEQIDGQQVAIKIRSRNPVIQFDNLQMYFGLPYVIDLESAQGKITIYEPTIGDIVAIGEKKFYSTLNIFITNTTSYKLMLHQAGIDWNTLRDFDLFCMLYKQIDPDAAALIFKDVNFQDFELYGRGEDDNKTIVLYNPIADIEINEEVYFHISQYLRAVFNIFPEEKITQDETLKNWYLRADSRKQEADSKLHKDEDNSIQPLISACVNHPGFKYKLKELKDMGICEFYDSVKRLQTYENATACLRGLYSGMVDGKQIDAESYNFMRKI